MNSRHLDQKILRYRLHLTSLMLMIALPLLAATVTRADTMPLNIRVYCESETSPCGAPSEADLRNAVLAMVGEANLEFQVADLSFRPDPISFHYGTEYNQITGQGHELLSDLHQLAAGPQVISVFLIPGLSSCWSGFPIQGERFIFCKPEALITTLAHELGHMLCQRHTFTDTSPPGDRPDPATHTNPDHDGDDLVETPRDPGPREEWSFSNSSSNFFQGQVIRDVGSNGTLLAERHWCDVQIASQVGLQPVNPDSPKGDYCKPLCKQTDPAAQVGSLALAPLTQNAMSYYDGLGPCRGPYVIGGNRFEAFVEAQVDSMHFCRNAVLNELPDVCPEGDADGDGWCDGEDTCPLVFGPLNLDSTGDGVGDICDFDYDNDGCNDDVDLNPRKAFQAGGSLVTANCANAPKSWQAWEGENTDGDRLLNCMDPDDDNDGILDAEDPCPTVPLPQSDPKPENHMFNCVKHASCPFEQWWDVCLLGGCNELLARIESVINPDPTQVLTFEEILIVGRDLYLGLPPNKTVAESLRAIAPIAYDLQINAGVTVGMLPPSEMRALDLVMKRDGRRVARVAEIDPSWVTISQPEFGRYVRVLLPNRTRQTLELSGSWGPHGSGSDGDRDGIPDRFDNCPNLTNRAQSDTDYDGHGDGCDTDLNNDGKVDVIDVERATECVGADFTALSLRTSHGQVRETTDDPPDRRIQARELLRLQHCFAADVDRNGIVDHADSQRIHVSRTDTHRLPR